jgi:hypothetical protein
VQSITHVPFAQPPVHAAGHEPASTPPGPLIDAAAAVGAGSSPDDVSAVLPPHATAKESVKRIGRANESSTG